MSLSRKLGTLDDTKKKKIEEQLQEKFPNSVLVQVLFRPRVLELIDSGQLWKSLNGSVDDQFAHSVMNSITTSLQKEMSSTEDMQEKSVFSYLLSSLQDAYWKKPIALVEILLEIYNFIQNLVDSEVIAGTSFDQSVHSSSNDINEDHSFDFDKNLEILEALVKENNNHIRKIQQKFEEMENLVFSQNNLEIDNLKITNNNSVNMQEKSNKLSEITKRIHENINGIEKQKQSIVASLMPLSENISNLVCTKNEDLRNHILSQISEWNHTKLRAQVGWPVHSFSNFLQPLIPVCDRFAKVLLSTHSQAQKLVGFLTKLGADMESLKQGEYLRNASRSMFCAFLKRCFVVDKQPPPTQLIDKVFSVSLRLLLGESVFFRTDNHPVVTCSLHSDDEIRCFQRANFANVRAEDVNLKSVTNNEKVLAYDEKTKSFFVSFDKLKLPRKLGNRKTKLDEDKNKLVTDQKNCLMFQTQITIGTEKFTIEAFSVPIVVMTNTSQSLEAEATIFWDNAFCSKGREPFASPDKVLLEDFLQALNKRWVKSNERELEESQLNFLARKLIPGIKFEELHNHYVTKQMFNKEHMRAGPCIFRFTFWYWFYKTLRLVKEFLYDEWRDGKIYGFIDKTEAEFKLREHLVGTFLLRFSDSIPGGISIVYIESMNVPGCNHVKPWVKDELKQKSFSNSMNDLKNDSDLKCIQYLYPSATPISEAFPQQDENNSEEKFNPRYPKKASLRVVRHDDGGSTSASNVSSNQSISFHNTSPPPSVERMCESIYGDGQPFSPSLPLESDPMFSHSNQYYPPEFSGMNTMMEGDSEDPFQLSPNEDIFGIP